MAHIRRRPNGKYQAIIYLGKDENGKQIRKCVTTNTLKECKIAAVALENSLKRGEVDG